MAAAAAAIPLAKASARPPSSAPMASSSAADDGVPWVREEAPPPRKLDASTIGWLSGSPSAVGRPATTAIVRGDRPRRRSTSLASTRPCSHNGRHEYLFGRLGG